ncbi:ABC transporter substrate-binding protein [Luethyella okanaganae]|uniref:ABC transporter substrate-binding protein n=1 Tax=Luethyella okanaganae TaxID=69372 RepID=A0ABW1VGF7_9MICO
MIRPLAALALLAGGVLALSGCSAGQPNEPGAVAGTFPATVQNCGASVTVDAAPKRIFLVNNDDVALLDALDALDRVVARTVEPLDGIYSDKTYQKLAAAELVAVDKNATGGAVVSQETILEYEPDLVLAPENAVNRESLLAAGIPVYSPPAYCSDPTAGVTGPATFERVYDQLLAFGAMLGVPETAQTRVDELKVAVDGLGAADNGTAAALYVPEGGGTLSPYGGPSMVTPVFEAAGLTNVYADAPDRVFDVNIEDLLQKDPQTIVLLYSSGTTDATVRNFTSVAGVEGLSAVRNHRVVALQFSFTDPPTPLSVEGARQLAAKLAELP